MFMSHADSFSVLSVSYSSCFAHTHLSFHVGLSSSGVKAGFFLLFGGGGRFSHSGNMIFCHRQSKMCYDMYTYRCILGLSFYFISFCPISNPRTYTLSHFIVVCSFVKRLNDPKYVEEGNTRKKSRGKVNTILSDQLVRSNHPNISRRPFSRSCQRHRPPVRLPGICRTSPQQ